MKIFIKEIKPEGNEIDYDIDIEDVGLVQQDFLYLIEPLHVSARVERVENTVLLKAKVNSRYKSYCSRTMVDVERDFSSEFLLDFPINKDIEFIELNEEIRQEVILSLPTKVLSDEEIRKDKELEKAPVGNEISQIGPEEERTYLPFADLKLKNNN